MTEARLAENRAVFRTYNPPRTTPSQKRPGMSNNYIGVHHISPTTNHLCRKLCLRKAASRGVFGFAGSMVNLGIKPRMREPAKVNHRTRRPTVSAAIKIPQVAAIIIKFQVE